jgi:hypothetical protein
MFRHIALFAWVADATDEQKQAVRDGLASLPGQIPELRSYCFGDDAGLREGNFDFGLVADFDDVDGWQAYSSHPAHQAVLADLIRPILANRAAIQQHLPD